MSELLSIGTKVSVRNTDMDDDRRLTEAKYGVVVGYWKDDPHTHVSYPYYINLLNDKDNITHRLVMVSRSAVSPLHLSDLKITITRKDKK